MKNFLSFIILAAMFAGASEAQDTKGQIILYVCCFAVMSVSALLLWYLEKKEEDKRNV